MKTGYVGIIGLPNAGKSTLVNALVGEKVSIVSAKPQTTRRRVLGIWNEADFQAVLVDSPGKIDSEKGLNAFLSKEYNEVIADAGCVIAVLNLDADKKEDLLQVLKECIKSEKLAAIIISKTDLPESVSRRVQLQKQIQELGLKVPVIEFSAHWKKDDFKQFKQSILDVLKSSLKEGERPIFDVELFTPHAVRELVTEIVREKCFNYLHQEVPYGLAVVIQKYEEDVKIDRINAEILVSQESHRPIVLGQGGSRIKQIGQESRLEIERLVGKKIFLGLQVRVKEKWDQDRTVMQKLGYSHDS